MRTLRFIAMASIGAALIAGWLLLRKDRARVMPTGAPPARQEADPAGMAAVAAEARSARVATAAGVPDYPRAYRESTDYLSLANLWQPLARDGDAAAQYWLSRVYRYCDQDYGNVFGFGHEGQFLTPEEVLQRWPTEEASQDPDGLRQIHRRCAELVQQGFLQFNDYDQLLRAASEAGYPRAQADMAAQQAGRGEAGTAEAIALARQALRSGDPEVVMATARLVLFLTAPNLDTSEAEVAVAKERASFGLQAWRVAACLRGADCSPQADWVRRRCRRSPACQPFETGTDLIRREEPRRFDQIMLRAREINDMIDAGRWDEIEFR